jgi:hypothetical protein
MPSIRSFLLAATLPLTVVACGGGDDGGTIIPEGEHYQYVASKAYVPTNNNQARDYGLDLDGDKIVDNQLGMVLGTLAGMGFDIQGTIDEAVAEGSIILLADFQTKDFTNTTAAGMQILLGDNPMPQPCTDPQNPTLDTCSKHLTGTGSFSIAAGSPMNAAVTGKIVNGTFTGGPGRISLQIALGTTESIQLDLIGARAKASGITADAISSISLAGALPEEDLNTTVIPAIQQQLVPAIAEDCTMLTAPPGCGCAASSTGATILELFDGGLPGSTKDCMVSVDEIKGNSLIQSLLAPDVDIDGVPALSLGIKIEAKKATFPAQ